MRRLETAVLCLGTALAAQALAVSPADAAAATDWPAEPARQAAIAPLAAIPADSVVDSYGIGVHLGFLNTPYTNALAVSDALEELGVRHVRDDLILSDNSPLQYAAIGLVAQQAGVKFNLIMGRPDRPGTPTDYVNAVATLVPPSAVESLEGVNEWDLSGPQGDTNPWVQEMKDWQAQLYAAAKADQATAALPVLSPSLAFKQSYAKAGDMSGNADLANAHMYPGGYRPSNEILQMTAALRASIPAKPLVVTESGYHNATASTGGHLGVPESVAATYAPRLLLEHVKRGHQRVYSYELLDEFADPSLINPEANFGLVRRDFSRKPSFHAMKNLIDLLEDPGPAFTPQPLKVTATGMPDDARYLLTQKRDGQWVLLLWRDVDVFDPQTQQPLSVTPADVTVRLEVPYDLAVHRPSDSANPASTTTASTLTLPLDGRVTAVTIDPTGPPAPRNVEAKAGDGRATVTWKLPATSATVTGFQVTRSPGAVTRTLPPDARTLEDKRLANGTRYTYEVRTLTSDGFASASPVAVTPATVPGAPRITSLSGSGGKVTVVWRAAKDNGRRVTRYRITVAGRTFSLKGSERRLTITGLPSREQLRLTVQARNAVGWGAKSDRVFGA